MNMKMKKYITLSILSINFFLVLAQQNISMDTIIVRKVIHIDNGMYLYARVDTIRNGKRFVEHNGTYPNINSFFLGDSQKTILNLSFDSLEPNKTIAVFAFILANYKAPKIIVNRSKNLYTSEILSIDKIKPYLYFRRPFPRRKLRWKNFSRRKGKKCLVIYFSDQSFIHKMTISNKNNKLRTKKLRMGPGISYRLPFLWRW